MKQEELEIRDVKMPIIKDNNIIYYPISYIMEKVLLKSTGQAGLQKEYSQYINKFNIDYGLFSGGTQETNCISEEGLKKTLENSKIGRLNIDQRKAMNSLLEYLHMDTICEDDRFIKNVSKEVINKYNIYIQDCIEYVLKEDPNIVWQRCTKCNNYYPYHINFFGENPHPGKEYPLYTFCRNCNDKKRHKDLIKHSNDEFRIVFNKYGLEIFNLYKEHNTIAIYNHWISLNIVTMPKIINNEDDKLIIIKHLYNKDMFKDYPEITAKVIHNICKFRVDGNNSNNFIQRIHKELFGIYLVNGVEFITDIKDAKKIFFDYINKYNLNIVNVYEYNYNELIKKSHLSGFMSRYNKNLLGLIMELYDNKYVAYKFKIRGDKYWDIKENRIRALKYLIEEDMKVPLQKVPLYITLTALRNNGGHTMYNVCKKYYKNLFEWVNEIYPDRFEERDFDIHYIRNNFDSIEEAEIHDILKKEFKNVIYNPRNTDRTIVIDGMIPDWFVFTKNKCWIIEYFGMNVERVTDNRRITEYQEKTKNKIEKYKKLVGYGKVYLYPEDLKDNFRGVYDKIKKIT